MPVSHDEDQQGKTPVATPTDGERKPSDGPDQRWERYCRLRETSLSIMVHGNFEAAPAVGAQPALRLDAGMASLKPGGPHWLNAPAARAAGDSVLPEPDLDWRFSSEVDMTIDVVFPLPVAESAPPEPVPVEREPAETSQGEVAPIGTADGKTSSRAKTAEAISIPTAAGPAESKSALKFRVDQAAKSSQAAGPHLAGGAAQGTKATSTDSQVNPTAGAPAVDTLRLLAVSAGNDSDEKVHRVDAQAEPLAGPHFLNPVIATGGALFPIDDAYRQLRDYILPHTPDGSTALAWLGAQPLEDGASLLTALAAALAERGPGNQVLLVDADFQLFSLSRRFRRPGSAGLGDIIAGKKPWRDAVLPTALAQIDVLPCGSLCDPQLATLTSGYWQRLLSEWKSSYRYIVIDAGSPEQPNLAAMLQAVDATYLVVEYDRTSRQGLTAAVDQLRRWGAVNLASVMVGVPAAEYVA